MGRRPEFLPEHEASGAAFVHFYLPVDSRFPLALPTMFPVNTSASFASFPNES
jgi:hypothetical protein